MYIDILIHLLWGWNIYIFIYRPLSRIIPFFWKLRTADIEFFAYNDINMLFSASKKTIEFEVEEELVLCKMYIGNGKFFQWLMSYNGEVVRFKATEAKKSWWRRHHECLMLLGPRKEKTPSYLKHRFIARIHTSYPMRKLMSHMVAERFVMAKMGGFKDYRNDLFI